MGGMLLARVSLCSNQSINMSQNKVTPDAAKAAEINTAAQKFALDVIRAQAAKGIGREFPQKRTANVVARVAVEMLDSFPAPDGADESFWHQKVLECAFATGPLMQGSTMQKAAVKAGIYAEGGSVASEYDTE